MKVSELTVAELASYCRIAEPTPEDLSFLSQALAATKAYIKSYTGLNDESVDKHEDFVIAVYILVQDMYDNRAMYIDSHIVPNATVETILGMHSVNLL